MGNENAVIRDIQEEGAIIKGEGFREFNFSSKSKCVVGIKNDKAELFAQRLGQLLSISDAGHLSELKAAIELVTIGIDGADAAKVDFVFSNGNGTIRISSTLIKASSEEGKFNFLHLETNGNFKVQGNLRTVRKKKYSDNDIVSDTIDYVEIPGSNTIDKEKIQQILSFASSEMQQEMQKLPASQQQALQN